MNSLSPISSALISLDGLSVGDAFGESFFGHEILVRAAIQNRELPMEPWTYTDDTIMAIGIIETLHKFGKINQDYLATVFARNYRKNIRRGYGGTAHSILKKISEGELWRLVTHQPFDGMGSMGNGGAMRAAPIGAFFYPDFPKTASEAQLSAEVTHGHPEGQMGAVAVAVAACLAKKVFHEKLTLDPKEFIEEVLKFLSESETKSSLSKALTIPDDSKISDIVSILGNGFSCLSQDTVPLVIWAASHFLHNYEEALWYTVSALGDRDTTCAMVGGIVSLSTGNKIPPEWLKKRESLSTFLPEDVI